MHNSIVILLISSTKMAFFFLPGLATGRSHAAGVQPDPATPSSALLASPAYSPCPDVNREIDLLAIGSLGCLTL